MGQVYRASDTKLKRQVAIKVLPSRALPWGLALAAALLAGWALWGRSGAERTARDPMYVEIGFPPDVEPLTVSTYGLVNWTEELKRILAAGGVQ